MYSEDPNRYFTNGVKRMVSTGRASMSLESGVLTERPFIPVRVAYIQSTDNTKCLWYSVATGPLIHRWGAARWYSHFGRQFHVKLNSLSKMLLKSHFLVCPVESKNSYPWGEKNLTYIFIHDLEVTRKASKRWLGGCSHALWRSLLTRHELLSLEAAAAL